MYTANQCFRIITVSGRRTREGEEQDDGDAPSLNEGGMVILQNTSML